MRQRTSGRRVDGNVVRVARRPPDLRRVAMLSVHTSPLEQPGTGDAGGLNVYVVEVARRLAETGIRVEVFTRATRRSSAPTVELAPGVLVRHVVAGPFEGLTKDDLPAQLCAFAREVLRIEAAHEPGYYDVIHSHYWLSGQVGALAKDRWGVPLVHSMHTLAKVKNSSLAEGDAAEPPARVIGEQQVVDAADLLVANTAAEAEQLIDLYDADPERLRVISPGVDLTVFRPGDRRAARAAFGLPQDAFVVMFAGRLQPLKAPDIVVEAVAAVAARRPDLRPRLVLQVIGGPSGTKSESPVQLRQLADRLGIADLVRFHDPVSQTQLAEHFRAASVVCVPSYNESFGLVALEAQACGTPVVASNVGGLPTAVRDGETGFLVDGHRVGDYARLLERLAVEERLVRSLGLRAAAHAAGFGWQRTAESTVAAYQEARDRLAAEAMATAL